MADAFIGEIRLLPYVYAPENWVPCNGQSLPSSSYQALFAVIGTTYGGDQRNFNVPNLLAFSVVGAGQGSGLTSYQLGQTAGVPTVTLTVQETPAHNHTLQKRTPADQTTTTLTASLGPNNAFSRAFVESDGALKVTELYAAASDGTTLAPSVIGVTGWQAHDNHQPNLALQYCICVVGVYPSPA
jgi:microcystin-dependent protein